MRLIIPGTLPSLNEMINASKSNLYRYVEIKKAAIRTVSLLSCKLEPIERADFIFTWYCPNRRRDKDNVIAGQKFVFDGLQVSGKLSNDGWNQIRDIVHRFEVDKQNPRVEVDIIEVKEGIA